MKTSSKIFGATLSALAMAGVFGMAQAQTPNKYNPDGKDNVANPPKSTKGVKTESMNKDRDGKDNVANPPKIKAKNRSNDEAKGMPFKDKDSKDNVANPPKFKDKKSGDTMSK